MSSLETRDISEAAALITAGAKLQDLKTKTEKDLKGVREQVVFVFDGDDLMDLRLKYLNKTLVGNLFEFATNLRALKSVSHNRLAPSDRRYHDE